MNREQILRLLAALGLKVSKDGTDGTMKEDDAVELKEKITAMETSASEVNKRIGEHMQTTCLNCNCLAAWYKRLLSVMSQ